jgi:hypothetical protein
MLREPRRMAVTRGREPCVALDAPAALTARTYAARGQVVFEVVDAPVPTATRRVGSFSTAGRRRRGSAHHRRARPRARRRRAGRILLGGVRPSALRAGLADERTPERWRSPMPCSRSSRCRSR